MSKLKQELAFLRRIGAHCHIKEPKAVEASPRVSGAQEGYCRACSTSFRLTADGRVFNHYLLNDKLCPGATAAPKVVPYLKAVCSHCANKVAINAFSSKMLNHLYYDSWELMHYSCTGSNSTDFTEIVTEKIE